MLAIHKYVDSDAGLKVVLAITPAAIDSTPATAFWRSSHTEQQSLCIVTDPSR